MRLVNSGLDKRGRFLREGGEDETVKGHSLGSFGCGECVRIFRTISVKRCKNDNFGFSLGITVLWMFSCGSGFSYEKNNHHNIKKCSAWS